MAPRRRRRPWYRTRAYRLTRTLVVTVALVAGGVWWAGDGEPAGTVASGAVRDDGAASRAPAGKAGTGHTPDARPGGDARGPRRHPSPAARRTARPAPPPAPLPRSRAVRLRIASLGVDAPVIGLRLDRRRRLAAPPVDDPKPVGWYTDGPTPGERGTALVVGHRDTRTGPAVFAPLERIRPGARVEARRVDGRTAVYTVDVVRTYAKAQFPDQEVYGNRGRAELRLITCGGAYDRRSGYAANVIAFAHLTQILGRAGAR
ncbi:class F sortase [Streptomyces sp. NBC_00328]|uniref:class F sortase n=1 Tax=Streptomyces sp. NBC_00328 TaxID=2903646 RepID=UPI002E28D402|nr:class F sortase [Streptomyces sp. NBC_00328]